jgi:enhancing lycopene biosynthesis protein 2
MPIPENKRNTKGFKQRPENINKNGRPPKLPALDELMAKVMGEMGESGLTAMEAILKAQRAKAAKGDTKAAELLLDRAYGKAKQLTDITTKGESMNAQPDLSKLSEDELKQMAAINRKIRE